MDGIHRVALYLIADDVYLNCKSSFVLLTKTRALPFQGIKDIKGEYQIKMVLVKCRQGERHFCFLGFAEAAHSFNIMHLCIICKLQQLSELKNVFWEPKQSFAFNLTAVVYQKDLLRQLFESFLFFFAGLFRVNLVIVIGGNLSTQNAAMTS